MTGTPSVWSHAGRHEAPVTGVDVQRLRPAHLGPVMDLELDLFGDEAWPDSLFHTELGDPGYRRYWRAVPRGTDPGDADAPLLGYAGLAHAPRAVDAWVQTIAVAPSAQGEGIGTRLLRHLLGTAARRGARQGFLEVRADNPVAQHLYAEHGFLTLSVEKGYYQPSGVDALVMQCDDLSPWAELGEPW